MSRARDEAIRRRHEGGIDVTHPCVPPKSYASGMPTLGLTLARQRTVRSVLGSYIALTKPRIIELLLVTTVPTMVVARRGLPSLLLILATLVGGALAAGGANAINMV